SPAAHAVTIVPTRCARALPIAAAIRIATTPKSKYRGDARLSSGRATLRRFANRRNGTASATLTMNNVRSVNRRWLTADGGFLCPARPLMTRSLMVNTAVIGLRSRPAGQDCVEIAAALARGTAASTVITTLLNAGVLDCGSACRGTRTFASG